MIQVAPRDVVQPAIRRREVPRIHCTDAVEFRERTASRDTPAIVTGLVGQWPAFATWTPSYFAGRYGDIRFRAGVDLPVDACPYDRTASDHIAEIPLRAAVEAIMASPTATYVRRQHVEKFPGAANDIGVTDLSPDDGKPRNVFVWIGKNTLTGLHFDFTQGMLCQLFGAKTVYLAAPGQYRRLKPIRASISKSRFLPSHPDFETFPGARDVEFWTTRLERGELLVIPRLWWHSVVSEGESISVSHDFGHHLGYGEIASMVAGCGPRAMASVSRDFIVHGCLGKPYVQRLSDDPPFGKVLHDMIAYSIRARLAPRHA